VITPSTGTVFRFQFDVVKCVCVIKPVSSLTPCHRHPHLPPPPSPATARPHLQEECFCRRRARAKQNPGLFHARKHGAASELGKPAWRGAQQQRHVRACCCLAVWFFFSVLRRVRRYHSLKHSVDVHVKVAAATQELLRCDDMKSVLDTGDWLSHTSHVIRHTSYVTRHTSHVTRHTSHVTRHTSHVTRDRSVHRSNLRRRHYSASLPARPREHRPAVNLLIQHYNRSSALNDPNPHRADTPRPLQAATG
jgi:hypothetical protein